MKENSQDTFIPDTDTAWIYSFVKMIDRGELVACRASVVSTVIVLVRAGAFLLFSHIFPRFPKWFCFIPGSISARHN